MGMDPNAFKVIQLESQVSALHMQCSRRLNSLIDVQVFLQDDDIEGALEYLSKMLPEV